MKFLQLASVRLLAVAVAAFNFNSFADDSSAASTSPREHLSLDANWKFHLGDDWPGALHLDKAGASTGPASEKFGDSAWRSLDLPHDWAIELPFDKNSDTSHGFKPVGPGYAKNSVGWYRRTFDLPAEDSGKRIWLTFDGVFRDATVWVNGWLVKRHEGGYYPFREDITDVAHFGGKNTIAVRVDATKFEGWFYEGAGIYRHVWLDKTAPVAIAPAGVFVSPRFENNKPEADVNILVVATLNNFKGNLTNSLPSVNAEIIAPNGESIVKAKSPAIILKPIGNEANEAIFGFTFTSKKSANGESGFAGQASVFHIPELWSPENPKLYKLVTTVSFP